MKCSKQLFGANAMDSALTIRCFYLFRLGENAVVD